MYQSILVPLDGSPFSARALPVAASLARRTGAALHLAIVHDPSAYVRFVPGEVTVPVFDKEAVRLRLEHDLAWVKQQASALSSPDLKVSGVLLEGTIVEALAEHAVAINADLTVMTTHGRSGLDRLWLGSIAAAILSRSPTPVFLVRPTGPEAPADGHQLPTGRLMVPLDGSPFGESVLKPATRFAEAIGLEMELIMVVVPHLTANSPFGMESLVANDAELQAEVEGARAYLDRLASTLPATTKTTVVTEMVVARALIDYAHESHPGAIAMATHGRSGFVRLMVGSVADKVLRSVDQPLFVYRPEEEPSS